jgi:hypothetical protein
MMKKTFLLLLLEIFLVGCGSRPKQQSVFENPVCETPCWDNIRPGVTTKEDALTILSKIDGINQSIVDHNEPVNEFDDWIDFRIHEGQPTYTSGGIYLLDNRVTLLHLGSEYGINLQRALTLFGAPQYILLLHTGFFDLVTLINPQKGISYGYSLYGAQSLSSSSIEPNVEITSIDFFDPKQYQQILNCGFLSAGILSGEETKKNLHTWDGYGSIKEKYWPPATP